MADSRVHLIVEDWIRREWMPSRYAQPFTRERVRLSSGGVFEFDALSADGTIIANISTSGLKTGGGNPGPGKVHKVRSDLYFLLLATAPRKLMLLSEPDMYEQWLSEVESGRVPASIEFVHVEVPDDLALRLQESRRVASREVTPT